MSNITITTPMQHYKNDIIPSGWSSLPINEVFEFIGTSSFSRNDLNYEVDDDSIYYIHYGDIHATYKNAILDFNTETRIPVLNKDIKSTTYFLKEGDLIIADASEDYEGIGEALEVYNLGDKKVLAGLHTFALRDSFNKTAHGYRAYIFKNHEVKNRLKTIATGSKVYGISKGNLTKFKITLPPYHEQQKIAQILSTWDKAIVIQQHLITQKQQNKKAIMKKLLTGEVRFKGFTDKWKEVRLGDLLDKIVGGGTPSRNNKSFWGDEIFWCTVKDFANFNPYGTQESITIEGLRKSSSNLIPKETIITPTRMALGKVAVFKVDVAINQDLKALFLKKNISRDFIFHWVCFNSDNIDFIGTGSTVKGITLGQLKQLPIKIPELKEEQQKIASFLSDIDKEINSLEKERIAMQKQKKGLMQQLLTGKVRVKI
jgi:type I restriction enzyme S subunit